MKIAILSRDGTLYSCKRLREAAMRRGHLVEILDPLSCYMNINPQRRRSITRDVVYPILTPLFPVLVRPLPFMVPLRYVSLSCWVAIR
ncbi:ribosomal protein S6 modification protein [Salmonella enterica subsp. diarizonae]|uniref:Ribosomal protein S6 modification protein n=1 Tax=Salmonella diarizonae TaxID=59204 RepID=A0A379U224_SALDZ|nr:ribosomal protein S6 modification protein [Salmonella enterica subsp. diarizonae]